MMDKTALLDEIIKRVDADLREHIETARDSHAAATDPENIARSKYETTGLECSYLAGAQAKFSAQLETDLGKFQALKLKEFNDSHAFS